MHAPAPAPAPPRALSGLKVLDFTLMIAGPYAGRLLADLGADVVKVESPEGDDMRQREPLRQAPDGSRHSTYYGQLNAGKRSIVLDLKTPAGIAQARALAAQADVLLENLRPGVMDRLGLGCDALQALNPRLVYASISGYGQQGPLAQRAAYAMMVHAMSGFDLTQARAAGRPGEPAGCNVFVADILGGLYAFSAIQTALLQRHHSGRGQRVDVALMDGMLNLLVYDLQAAQFAVQAQRPNYGPVKALDGSLIVAPVTDRNFQALCEATGLASLRDDPRFATVGGRAAHWQAMSEALAVWTGPRRVDEAVALLEAAGVPAAPFREPGDNLADAHLRQRGLFSPVADAAGGFTGVNPPWQLSASASSLGARVAALGEDGEAVRRDWLGPADPR